MGDYSSGDEATLPSGVANLEHVYDAADLAAVGTDDASYVEQTATGEYPIHQYKDTITSSLANITWIGKSDQAPSTYPVYLQIYKTAAPAAWETIATKNTGSAGVDFTLQKLAQDTSTNYKDGSNVVCCRVYQEFSAGSTIMDSFTSGTDNRVVSAAGDGTGISQSFTGNGKKITSIEFDVRCVGSPPGNVAVKVYLHSGVYGTSSIPDTGNLVATADAVAATSLPGAFAFYSFTFTGAQQYTTSNGTKYVATLEYAGGDGGNFIWVHDQQGVGTGHDGNEALLITGTWTPYQYNDVNFKVYGV